MNKPRREILRITSALTATTVGISAVATAQESPEDDLFPQSVTSAEIQTTSRECATQTVSQENSNDDWAQNVAKNEMVEISGQMEVPNPCHDAVFVKIERDKDTLYVTIGANAQDEMCIMCLGTIEYEATIELSEPVKDVVVR